MSQQTGDPPVLKQIAYSDITVSGNGRLHAGDNYTTNHYNTTTYTCYYAATVAASGRRPLAVDSSLSASADIRSMEQVKAAYTSFREVITPDDDFHFGSTELSDVRKAALDIQKRLASRGTSRNTARLERLLVKLDQFSQAADVLCKGSPYMPYIWAPVKLFMQVSSEYAPAFDKILTACTDVADALPRFDLLAIAVKDFSDFQKVLSAVYSDMLEFHTRVYKIIRCKSWQRFFSSSWARFDYCSTNIVQSIEQHARLADDEANAASILRLEDLRQRSIREVAKKEDDRRDQQFLNVLNWLNVRNHDEEDQLETILSLCHQGTVDWFFSHPKYKRWLASSTSSGVSRQLWVHGMPGSGKSVLCANVIKSLQQEKMNTVAYHVHDYRSVESGRFARVVRSLVHQLVRQQKDMAGFVHDEYICKGCKPSAQHLTRLLLDLVSGDRNANIVIDGLDECADADIKKVLGLCHELIATSDGQRCRVLLFSREVTLIQKAGKSKKWPAIALEEEKQAIDAAIRMWTHSQMEQLCHDREDLFITADHMKNIEMAITAKAQGMFLWVRLVLTTMQDVDTPQELEEAVRILPPGLERAYGRILERLEESGSSNLVKVCRTHNLMAWIALAERPLRCQEILSGITLGTEPHLIDDTRRIRLSVLDQIRPLIDVKGDGTVSFVHFTVKEYILSQSSTRSGPYLAEADGHSHIAHACVAYLRSSLNLVDENFAESDLVLQVAKGFHSLHSYAFGYWSNHLDLAARERGIQSSASLRAACEAVLKRHAALLEAKMMPSLSNHNIASPTLRLDVMASLKALKILMYQPCLIDNDKEGSQSQGQNILTADQRTLFDLSRQLYNEIVANLMDAGARIRYPYIDEALLSAFRETNASNAFCCRFHHCARKFDGFADEDARREHENCHVPRIMCTETSCTYASQLGFKTAAELQRHVKTYHHHRDKSSLSLITFGKRPSAGMGRLTKDHLGFQPDAAPRVTGADVFTNVHHTTSKPNSSVATNNPPDTSMVTSESLVLDDPFSELRPIKSLGPTASPSANWPYQQVFHDPPTYVKQPSISMPSYYPQLSVEKSRKSGESRQNQDLRRDIETMANSRDTLWAPKFNQWQEVPSSRAQPQTTPVDAFLDPNSTSTMQWHTPTPPHLLPRITHWQSLGSSPHASPNTQRLGFQDTNSISRPRGISETFDPSRATYPQENGDEWLGM